MIQFFDRSKIPYDSIHSFIMESFGKEGNYPSMVTMNHFIVITDKKSSFNECFSLPLKKYKMGQKITIECNLAFDNRHTTKKEQGDSVFAKKLYAIKAIEKFEQLSGLKKIEKEIRASFMGVIREKKFTIHNAFRIEGIFQVDDELKLEQALKNGIGSRKSYGFGLILTMEQENV